MKSNVTICTCISFPKREYKNQHAEDCPTGIYIRKEKENWEKALYINGFTACLGLLVGTSKNNMLDRLEEVITTGKAGRLVNIVFKEWLNEINEQGVSTDLILSVQNHMSEYLNELSLIPNKRK